MHRSLDLDVPPKKVFAVLAAYDVYSEWIPDVSHARMLFGEGDIAYAEFVLCGRAGEETITLELIHERPRSIQFRQVSCPSRPWRGRWDLEATEKGTRLWIRYDRPGGLLDRLRPPRFGLVEAIADAIRGHVQSIYATAGIPLMMPGSLDAEGTRVLLDVVQERDRLVIWLFGKRYELLATKEGPS